MCIILLNLHNDSLNYYICTETDVRLTERMYGCIVYVLSMCVCVCVLYFIYVCLAGWVKAS